MEDEGGKHAAALFAELCDAAFRNLSRGLKISVALEARTKMLQITRLVGFASSALALPGFFEQAATWLDATEILVGFGDGHRLLGAPLGTAAARKIEATIRQQRPSPGVVNIYPRVLLFAGGRLTEVFVGRQLATAG